MNGLERIKGRVRKRGRPSSIISIVARPVFPEKNIARPAPKLVARPFIRP